MRTALIAASCVLAVVTARAEYSTAEEIAVALPDKATIIATLGLEAHIEGGYFARTFQPDHRPQVETPLGPRYTMTSIHYLLTDDSPIGHWHRNESDIVHFHHLGAPVHYTMLHPDGRLETAVLGPDLAAGQRLQLTVRGGVWKASHLPTGEYGLISEAVAPGFDYADMALGTRADLLAQFPQHAAVVRAYTRE
jgi:predicted cupin superfamily sugar epimerase